ncbi:hypothetical protein DFAR_1180012 [Desulfarculales bacterium]
MSACLPAIKNRDVFDSKRLEVYEEVYAGLVRRLAAADLQPHARDLWGWLGGRMRRGRHCWAVTTWWTRSACASPMAPLRFSPTA